MKLKYYLRGVGIGVIFAAIVLMVSHSINKSSEISEVDAIKRVKELGYTVERQKDTQSDEPETQTTEKDTTVPDTQTPETQKPETEQPETQQPSESESAVFIINTNNETSWRDAFKTLQNAKVIEDADDLYNYYNEKYEETAYLINGSHEIPYGADYDTIIKILSTRN